MPNQRHVNNSIIYAAKDGTALPKEVLDSMNVFNKRAPKGTIDVWWLYDDGGLTMLLPHIISARSIFTNCKLRVFALTNRKLELEMEERK